MIRGFSIDLSWIQRNLYHCKENDQIYYLYMNPSEAQKELSQRQERQTQDEECINLDQLKSDSRPSQHQSFRVQCSIKSVLIAIVVLSTLIILYINGLDVDDSHIQSNESFASYGPTFKSKQLTNISNNHNKSLKRSQQLEQSVPQHNQIQNSTFLQSQYIQNATKFNFPLELPIRNSKDQKIEDFLYTEDEIVKRIAYQKQRINFIDKHSRQFSQLHLAKHNIIVDSEGAKQAKVENEAEYKRLNLKYNLSVIKQELPMCIISTGYNNKDNFRIQYSLNSIFTQDYQNYKLILINDASDDGSHKIYQSYFDFIGLNQTQHRFIVNKKRLTALQNFYIASTKFCDRQSIIVVLDADDELIGRNVLKLFNWAYQTHKIGIAYSNFYWYIQSKTVINGFTYNQEYNQTEKEQRLYRNKTKISHLRTYRNSLFLQINPKDLKDKNGNFYTISADYAIFMPLLELSCGKIYKFKDEFHYLYNSNTGINDNKDRQWRVYEQIKRKERSRCSKKFEQEMKGSA